MEAQYQETFRKVLASLTFTHFHLCKNLSIFYKKFHDLKKMFLKIKKQYHEQNDDMEYYEETDKKKLSLVKSLQKY